MAVPVAIFLIGVILAALALGRLEQQPHEITEVRADGTSIGAVISNSDDDYAVGRQPAAPAELS